MMDDMIAIIPNIQHQWRDNYDMKHISRDILARLMPNAIAVIQYHHNTRCEQGHIHII